MIKYFCKNHIPFHHIILSYISMTALFDAIRVVVTAAISCQHPSYPSLIFQISLESVWVLAGILRWIKLRRERTSTWSVSSVAGQHQLSSTLNIRSVSQSVSQRVQKIFCQIFIYYLTALIVSERLSTIIETNCRQSSYKKLLSRFSFRKGSKRNNNNIIIITLKYFCFGSTLATDH